jgi:hypothetical protein
VPTEWILTAAENGRKGEQEDDLVKILRTFFSLSLPFPGNEVEENFNNKKMN